MNESLSINKNIQSGFLTITGMDFFSVRLTGDVFCTERVFLYRHGPTEHTVILVGSILQVF